MKVGVWINAVNEFGSNPAKARDAVIRLAESGVTDLYVFAFSSTPIGDKLAPIGIQSDLFEDVEQIDVMGPLTEASHQRGVCVHLVMLPFTSSGYHLKGLPQPEPVSYMTNQFMEKRYYCVTDPAHLVRNLAILHEVHSRYGINGAQLDSIRDRESILMCMCPRCVKAVAAFFGGEVPPIKELSGHLSYRYWYAKSRDINVTRLVRAIHELSVGLEIKLSMAARDFSQGGSGFGEGQDWPTWVRDDIMGMVTPMTYRPDNMEEFKFVVLRQLMMAPDGFKNVWPSIGVTSSSGVMDESMFEQQLDWLIEQGVPGISIFSYNGLTDGMLKILRSRILS